MLAGRRVRFHAHARIGEAFTRTSTIAKIEEKQGRSGRLVFVTVRHDTAGPAGPVMSEWQDIVYREAGGGSPAPRTAEPMPAPAWREVRTPDPVLLFRYSAICFNGHRIHYDADYARAVEGYPALVVERRPVHPAAAGGSGAACRPGGGGLRRAHRLAAVLRSARLPFAARAPDAQGHALLWAEDDAGTLALRVEVEFAP